jgi:hypothetical protein
MEGKRYCCGKEGHKSPQYHFKDKPRSEWAINKVQQNHAQTNKTTGKANQDTTNKSNKESVNQSTKTTKNVPNQASTEGWTGVNYNFHQDQDMKNWILLDNELLTTIFCNPNMVSDTCNTKNK